MTQEKEFFYSKIKIKWKKLSSDNAQNMTGPNTDLQIG